jgi:glycosyltransferase involved in cell wall biosynthesis
VRRAWGRKSESLFLVVDLVPAAIRRPLARPVAFVAESLADRGTGLRINPQVAFIARWAAGDRAVAAERARRLGTSRRLTPGARRSLARLAFGRSLRGVASEIVDSAPDDRSPAAEMIRARIDQEEGRYGSALGHARAAITDVQTDAERLVEMLEARLAIMTPGWQPNLGRDLGRLEQLRGTVDRGTILHLVFASLPYHHSGYSLRSQSVAVAQRAAGLNPRFATRAGFPRTMGVVGARSEESVDGIPYYRLAPDFPPGEPADRLIAETIRAAIPLVERFRPAAIQPASNHVQAQIALAMGGPLGIPVVYEVRGFWEETWVSHPWHDADEAMATDHYGLSRDTETRAMLASDAVVTISETMRQAIIERGCRPENVVVIANAVDVDRFTPVPRDDALAASLGIQPGDTVVGYISSLNPYEGIRYLLEAAALLRSRRRKLRVLLVGDGSDHDALVETAHRLGLDDGTLIMPGRVAHEAILGYYSIIDVFVVPRTADRVSRLVTPLKPYEAMAMERAVVVSDVPALREMVVPGETGVTFRPEDATDLADVIGSLLDDPAMRSRLGRQAREWVLANRTWAQNGQRYRELYERLGVI